MAMDGIRGYLQLASGLVELSRAKATEAAAAVLALPGSVAGGMSGSVPAAAGVPGQVQDLAEELMAAAAANRRSLIALVRAEIESALGKAVVVPVDELDRARAAVAKLSADVEELRDQVLASPAVRSIPEPGRSALTTVSDAVSGAMSGAASSVLAHGASLTRTQGAPGVDDALSPVTRRSPSSQRPSRSAVKAGATPTTPSTPTPRTATKTAVTKRATKKSSAASTPATKAATTRKSSAASTPAKRSSAGSTPPVKAATTRKRSAASTPPVKAATTRRSSAAATPPKKATPTKKAATTKKAPTTGGGAG